MPAPKEDLALLVEAARRAGDIAQQFFRKNPNTWDKGDEGPVTEADIAIDTMLRDTLLDARPDYGWLSEESEDDGSRLAAKRVFICDPIDGTRAFIEGQSSFSHSLAVAREGQITAAVVYLPIRDKLYAAFEGGGTTLNGVGARASTRALEGAEVLTTKANLNDVHWPKGQPPIKRAYRPSLAYRMSLVGEGRFDAMMTFRDTWEWDVAAGTLIISEAGGRVSDARGHDLRFNNSSPQVDGVIAGGVDLHAGLLELRR